MPHDPDVHPVEIATRFEELEREGNAKAQGANYEAILIAVAAEYDLPIDEVRRIVIDHTFTEAN